MKYIQTTNYDASIFMSQKNNNNQPSTKSTFNYHMYHIITLALVGLCCVTCLILDALIRAHEQFPLVLHPKTIQKDHIEQMKLSYISLLVFIYFNHQTM